MFERSNKDDNTIESQNPAKNETDGTFGSLRSKVTGRSSEVAVIGSSIQINGDLRGDEDLRIEGKVSGTVELKNSALTIGKEGKVKAGVYAKSIAVDGETKGDLCATERVSVHVNARVQGNIIAPKVSIEEGAHFKGSIEMDPSAVERALGTVKSSSSVNTVSRKATGKTAASKAAPGKTETDAGTTMPDQAGAA